MPYNIERAADVLDCLTGFLKPAYFMLEFEGCLRAADDDCEDVTLLIADIDNMLSVNDRYGHAAGDAALKTLAEHLKRADEKNFSHIRYGGDAFAVIMPSCEKEKAFLTIEKIREAYCNADILFESEGEAKTIKCSFTGGIATYREDGQNAVELLRKAENALYRAKTSGRNKICIAKEEKMVTKTSHYATEQLHRLSALAKERGIGEAIILREALDEILKKYADKKSPPNGKTVLIVDDAPFMRMMLKDILTKKGYEVRGEADNGKTAVEVINMEFCDFVLLDIAMPEMDGIGVLQNICKRDGQRIIMVSALCDPPTVIECVEHGADYFVAKPFQQETLVSALTRPSEQCFDRSKLDEYAKRISETKIPIDHPLTQPEIEKIFK